MFSVTDWGKKPLSRRTAQLHERSLLVLTSCTRPNPGRLFAVAAEVRFGSFMSVWDADERPFIQPEFTLGQLLDAYANVYATGPLGRAYAQAGGTYLCPRVIHQDHTCDCTTDVAVPMNKMPCTGILSFSTLAHTIFKSPMFTSLIQYLERLPMFMPQFMRRFTALTPRAQKAFVKRVITLDWLDLAMDPNCPVVQALAEHIMWQGQYGARNPDDPWQAWGLVCVSARSKNERDHYANGLMFSMFQNVDKPPDAGVWFLHFLAMTNKYDVLIINLGHGNKIAFPINPHFLNTDFDSVDTTYSLKPPLL